ncbi:hypothetical protein MASR2M54_25640 [Aliarcobacter cryaerophilus]
MYAYALFAISKNKILFSSIFPSQYIVTSFAKTNLNKTPTTKISQPFNIFAKVKFS